MTVKIRAHHLFCMTLYEGKGYSRAFVSNMDRITERIRNGEDVKLQILAEADCLCRACPHLEEGNVCRLDQNSVKETDLKVIRVLGLQEGSIYSVRECGERMRRNWKEEIFEEVCGNCSWKKKGICTWEKMKERGL